MAGTSNGDFALVRYNPDGSLATSEPAPRYSENGPAVKLDAALTLADAELGAANKYNGTTVTVARQGGASAEDVLALDATGALFTMSQNKLLYNGLVFGDFTSSNGTLTLHFSGTGKTSDQRLAE